MSVVDCVVSERRWLQPKRDVIVVCVVLFGAGFLLRHQRCRRRRTLSSTLSSIGVAGWRRLAHTSDFFDVNAGWKAYPFEHDSVKCVAMYRDGKCVAFSRTCPHAGIDLVGGDLEDLGEGIVIACPAHSFLFDAATGLCLWDASRGGAPTTPALLTFDTCEVSDAVWVRVKLPAVASEVWDQVKADKLQMKMIDLALERKFPSS